MPSQLRETINYSKLSVLIIEDFAEFARSLRVMLQSMGCQHINVVYNGEDAIQACREKKFDTILADYNLGQGKDGQQVLEELRAFKLLKATTVYLILTAENTTAMVMGAIEMQPDAYLTKPFNKQLLKSRLDRAITRKQTLLPINRLMEQQDWPAAIVCCDEIATKNPRYAGACKRLKYQALRENKQYDQAFALALEQANERILPWAAIAIGEIHYLRGNFSAAADAFQEAINRFPMLIEAYDWLADVQLKLGQTKQAQMTLQAAVEKSPKRLARQRTLGRVAEQNEDIEVMTEAYRQAVKFGENSAFSHPDEYVKLTKSLGMQLAAGNRKDRERLIEEAENVFARLNARFKSEPRIQFRSAVAQADFSKLIPLEQKVAKYLDLANRYFEKVEEHLTPEESIEIAQSLKDLGQNELAEVILEESAEQHFDNKEFLQQVEALTSNQHLVKNSRKVSQLNAKAIQLFKTKKYIDAIDFFEQARAIAPNNIDLNLNLAQALLKYFQAENQDPKLLLQAQSILESITKLPFVDPRFNRFSELNRLTQLLIQRVKV